jgi:hypothetical protein
VSFETKWKALLKESSLSRIHSWIEKADVAIVTGFRDDPYDLAKCPTGASTAEDNQRSPKATNMLRNRDLKAALLSMRYGVTKVKGSYIEDFDTPQAIEVREDSMLVVNLEEDPSFISNITMLGKKFCQDSVLIIPKGGQGAYLHGTNNSEFPGLDQKVEVGSLKMGAEDEFMTRVDNRPFTFNESLDTYKKLSRLEKQAVDALSKLVLD